MSEQSVNSLSGDRRPNQEESSSAQQAPPVVPLDKLTVKAEVFEDFCSLLGKDPASTRIRAFPHKSDTKNPQPPHKGNWKPGEVTRLQRAGLGVYAVINDGGDSKAEIKACRAFFVEWDDRPIDWQLQAWRELDLPEPTFIVLTGGRSAHLYWVLSTPITPEKWEPIQVRLLAYSGADPAIKDCSRVMRAPGCWYIGAGREPLALTVIAAASGKRYSVSDLEACLPVDVPPTTQQETVPQAPAAKPYPHQAQARGLDEIQAALHAIPRRVAGSNTYETYRNILWGLVAACAEAGLGLDAAIDLMEDHSPSKDCGWDIQQVAASGNGRIKAATFWKQARDAGWKPSGHPPKAGKGKAKEPPQRLNLATDEVVRLLPERIGQPRLNIRTQAIHLPDRVITGNEASLLYLDLSSEDEIWRKSVTTDALDSLARRSPFDPALEHLQALTAGVEPLPMEEWERLDQLLLNVDDPIAAAYLPRYLIAAVARLYQPGAQVDQCPVLIGPQGIGKSQLGKELFGAENYGDQLTHRLDVDDVTRLHRYWVCELAELDGITSRSDQEALKAFLSRQVDTERRKYGRDHEELPRRSVFWGTANAAPLRDPTGARRFVCIPLPDVPLPLERVRERRAAIWARAIERYRARVQWFSTPEEVLLNQERNLDHQQVDPWSEPVCSYLKRQQERGNIPVQFKDLLDELEIPTSQQNNHTCKRVRQLAEALGWVYGRHQGKRGLIPPA